MALSRAGKVALVKVAADDVSLPVTVGGVKSYTHDDQGRNVFDTELGDTFETRMQNLKDAVFHIEGGRRLSDAGQAILLTGLTAGTAVFVQIRPGDRAEFQQNMRVSKFSTEVDIDGRATFACELQGDGAYSLDFPSFPLRTQGGDYIQTEANDYLTTEG